MMPWYLGDSRPFFWMIPFALWSAAWTGVALWYAARRDEMRWFIFFLFVHTMGLGEILYLLFVVKAFAKEKKTSSRRRRS